MRLKKPSWEENTCSYFQCGTSVSRILVAQTSVLGWKLIPHLTYFSYGVMPFSPVSLYPSCVRKDMKVYPNVFEEWHRIRKHSFKVIIRKTRNRTYGEKSYTWWEKTRKGKKNTPTTNNHQTVFQSDMFAFCGFQSVSQRWFQPSVKSTQTSRYASICWGQNGPRFPDTTGIGDSAQSSSKIYYNNTEHSRGKKYHNRR